VPSIRLNSGKVKSAEPERVARDVSQRNPARPATCLDGARSLGEMEIEESRLLEISRCGRRVRARLRVVLVGIPEEVARPLEAGSLGVSESGR
jgi:hypothetical protein